MSNGIDCWYSVMLTDHRAASMELNVASMVKMAKYAIPEMEKNSGQWRGSIVNIASVAGLRGGNPHLLYPTSKGAIVVGSPVAQTLRGLANTTNAEHD